jgi:K+-sensing histidine kinase KdpD
MNIRNARRWAPRGIRPWLYAGAALAIASAVRLSLHPLLGPVMPGSTFCIAAVLIEYYFGLAPALAVMVFGLPIADYLFVPPYRAIGDFDQRDIILIVSYPLITLLILVLIESLRRVRYQAELLTEVARSRYDMLLRADNERALAERAADTTHRLLDLLTTGRDKLLLCKAPGAAYQWHAATLPMRLRAAIKSGITANVTADIKTGVTASATEEAGGPDDEIGALFDSLHPDDRARLAADGGGTAPAYVAERFVTRRGEFVVVRRPDEAPVA